MSEVETVAEDKPEAEVPWEPALGEFVRILHDASYRRVPPFEREHDDDSWEGLEGEIVDLDFEEKTARVYHNGRGYGVTFPFDDLIPLDRLKRPEGAVDGAWVQIETGKYDGMLAQIRGWYRGKLHIQRAGGPVEAYRPEELELLRGPGGLRGGDSFEKFVNDAEAYMIWRDFGTFPATPDYAEEAQRRLKEETLLSDDLIRQKAVEEARRAVPAIPAVRSPRQEIAHVLGEMRVTPEAAEVALRIVFIGELCGLPESHCCVLPDVLSGFIIRYEPQPLRNERDTGGPRGGFFIDNAGRACAFTSCVGPAYVETRECGTTEESLRMMFAWIRAFFIEESKRADGDKA